MIVRSEIIPIRQRPGRRAPETHNRLANLRLQREQIAALKAFGYYNWQIGWHFLKFVLLIAMAGGVVGTFGGPGIKPQPGNDVSPLIYSP